jgi:hypothetical protein
VDTLSTGTVAEYVKQSIERADVVIAVLTESNPNVFYELGLAHALGKPTILIATSLSNVPIDVRGSQILFFNREKKSLASLSAALEAELRRVTEELPEAEKLLANFVTWIESLRQLPEKGLEFEKLIATFLRSVEGFEVMEAEPSNLPASYERLGDFIVWNHPSKSGLRALLNPVIVEVKTVSVSRTERSRFLEKLDKVHVRFVLVFYLGSGSKFEVVHAPHTSTTAILIPANKQTIGSPHRFLALLRKTLPPPTDNLELE